MVDFARTVGITETHLLDQLSSPEFLGVNWGQQYYKVLADYNGPEKAKSTLKSMLFLHVSMDPRIVAHIIDAVSGGGEVVTLQPFADKHVVTHEFAHTLAGKLGVPYNEITPGHILRSLAEELPEKFKNYDWDWINRTHEAYTEVLTNYFMGNFKPDSPLHQLSERMIMASDDPNIRSLIGTALGLALVATGAYKQMEKQ